MRELVNRNKKPVMIIGFVFVICLQCCVFPAINRSHQVSDTLVFMNFIIAVGVCKCTGELEVFFFKNETWMQVLGLNFVLTLLGMGARYLLEYGEVSNNYNFTFPNILLHTVMIVLWSTVFWKSRIKELSEK